LELKVQEFDDFFWLVVTSLGKALGQGHYQNQACTWLSITSCTLILECPQPRALQKSGLHSAIALCAHILIMPST